MSAPIPATTDPGSAARAVAEPAELTAPGPASWRVHAETLRRQAAELERIVADLLPHDRPDVWAGARADAFRAELADHVRVLQSPLVGVTTGLREAARRLDARADAVVTTPVPGGP